MTKTQYNKATTMLIIYSEYISNNMIYLVSLKVAASMHQKFTVYEWITNQQSDKIS